MDVKCWGVTSYVITINTFNCNLSQLLIKNAIKLQLFKKMLMITKGVTSQMFYKKLGYVE